MKMLWTSTSKNTKTGNIPQGYVGETKEDTLESCEGCPIMKKCYHHSGTPRMAHASMQRSHKNKPRRYELSNALAGSVRTARYVRGAVGGDPSVFSREVVQGWRDEIKGAGMEGLLLYTHFWDGKGSHLKGLAMASVDSLEAADKACDEGWRAAVVLPVKGADSKHSRVKSVPVWDGSDFTTPEGRRVVVCPAQRPELRKDCNTCGLCEPTRAERVEVIGFLQH
jgi:hypothetical protein|tara:strand:+ start:1025 stop:1696 length:672 start_codon:yes stop_codon:yes gene_type:complete